MNQSAPRQPKYKLNVKRSEAGLGLYAGEDIPKNRFVIEYWGELVPTPEADKIGGKYLFDLENGKTILGATRKNVARYINHSCRPNCEVRTTASRVYIFTRRNIRAGEELNYDYGDEYFDMFIKPYGCRCVKCAAKK